MNEVAKAFFENLISLTVYPYEPESVLFFIFQL